jgi:hypothetical protein
LPPAAVHRRAQARCAKHRRTEPFLRGTRSVLANMEKLSAGDPPKPLLVYSVPPITGTWTRPHDKLILGKLTNELRVAASPGEYEPASFVVSGASAIHELLPLATDLEGENGSIPASAVDIKVVKCWYQSGTAGVGHDQRKNESFPDGPKRVWISDPAAPAQRRVVPSTEQFPVKDSPDLLPVDVPAGSNKQFWVTLHVPDDATPGNYTGRIDLRSEDTVLASVRLHLRVLPIRLLPPYYTSSIYHDGLLDPAGKGTISSARKSEEQYRNELKNLIAHGVTDPILPLPLRSGGPDTIYAEDILRKMLAIRKELGMAGRPLYSTRFFFRALELKQPKLVPRIEVAPALKERLQAEVRRFISLARSYGVTDIYFYGLDEAKGERLTCQREAWKAIREAGGKIYASGVIGMNFREMGDIQDILVCAGSPWREEADRWHGRGRKIWCYANPQGGIEDAEINRRNFGLLLWQTRYDGAATWAYQSTAGNTWNDFDSPRARDYNFTYPTVNGVIDTIQWEGYREGVDDVRYVTTLEQAIERAGNSNDPETVKRAKAAEQYLQSVDVATCDLDTVRQEIIAHILRLSQAKENR